MMDLKELVRMSNEYGANPDYVLAGGGNTSVKDQDTLYVKCSGTCLADITEKGFVAMDRKKLDALMEKTYPEGDKEREAAFLADVMDARCDEDLSKRPSVEALLHNLFPQKYVLHVHPALVNGLTCGQNGEKLAFELLGEELIWIPICRPGYILGKLCNEAMKAYEEKNGKRVQVALLQNHGIFVAGETVDEIGRLFSQVIKGLSQACTKKPDLAAVTGEERDKAQRAALAMSQATGKTVGFVDAAAGLCFASSRETALPLSRPFTPDHIVYCGPYPLYLEKEEEIIQALQQWEKEGKPFPKVILLKGIGAFVMAEDEAGLTKPELLLRDAMKVAIYAESFGGPLPMTEELTEFIIHWEAESYRKKQSA